MAKSYVKYSAPSDLQSKVVELIEAAKNSGSIRKGTNEATKAIEKGEAKLVVIAEDVEPEEIVMHLPMLCAEKRIPFTYISEKVTLGKAAGLGVGTAAIAVSTAGSGESLLKEVLTRIQQLNPSESSAKPAAEVKEKKAAPVKKEEKKEEKK